MDMDATLDNVIYSYNHKVKNNCEILGRDFLTTNRMVILTNNKENVLLFDKPKHITFEFLNKKSKHIETIHILNIDKYEYYGCTDDGKLIISIFFNNYLID